MGAKSEKISIKEEDLYEPVKTFLEANGYSVNSEVNFCDVTAVKGDELVIVELKKNLSVELIIQGVLRQKLTSDVYIAVPKFKRMKKKDELNNIIYLLRRLELGLLLVDIKYNRVEVVTEPKQFDLEKSRERSKKRVAALLTEINKRSMDLNKGGSRGKKLVTGYREQVILIACILKKYGEQFPKEIRTRGGNAKKTLGILKNNYYRWFEALANGKYALSELGMLELEEYKELTDVFFKELACNNKILYISDLDGTLLNSAACVSKNTAEILNRLIASGVCFSVATARSPSTVFSILKGININIPIVLMNGVLVYDILTCEYLLVNSVSQAKAKEIIKLLGGFDINYFMYTLKDKVFNCWYKNPVRPAEVKFLEDRIKLAKDVYCQTSDFKKSAANNDVIYFSMIAPHDILSEIFGKLSEISGITTAFYMDNYSEDWFLEVFSVKASKKSGAEFVASHVSSQHIVAFGDNLNDIEFMKAANEAYAVSNAVEAAFKVATGVILSNDEDGVAKFIEANEFI